MTRLRTSAFRAVVIVQKGKGDCPVSVRETAAEEFQATLSPFPFGAFPNPNGAKRRSTPSSSIHRPAAVIVPRPPFARRRSFLRRARASHHRGYWQCYAHHPQGDHGARG